MSHKYVGPVGKQFRGDEQRAMTLMGSARLLAQRGLDKIESRGGWGVQVERQILGDGSTVEAWVNKQAGQPPLVRVRIWCPEPKGEEAWEFVSLGVPSSSSWDVAYITPEGFEGQWQTPTDPFFANNIWLGYQGGKPLVITSWDQIYKGNVQLTDNETANSYAIGISNLSGASYILEVTTSYELKQIEIFATQINKNRPGEPIAYSKGRAVFKAPYTFLGLSPTQSFYFYGFQFSPHGTKLVCTCNKGQRTPGDPKPVLPRTYYYIEVYECTLPTEYPEVNDEGEVVELTLLEFTKVFDSESLVNTMEYTHEIGLSADIWEMLGEEPTGPIISALSNAYESDPTYVDRSFQVTTTTNEEVETFLGAGYENTDELIIKKATQIAVASETMYCSLWYAGAGSGFLQGVYLPEYGPIDESRTEATKWWVWDHRVPLFHNSLDELHGEDQQYSYHVSSKIITSEGEELAFMEHHADNTYKRMYNEGAFLTERVFSFLTPIQTETGTSYIGHSGLRNFPEDKRGVNEDILEAPEPDYKGCTWNYTVGVDDRISQLPVTERKGEGITDNPWSPPASVTYDFYQGRDKLFSLPMAERAQRWGATSYCRVPLYWMEWNSEFDPYFYIQIGDRDDGLVHHTPFMLTQGDYLENIQNIKWPKWAKVDAPTDAVVLFDGVYVKDKKISDRYSTNIWPGMESTNPTPKH